MFPNKADLNARTKRVHDARQQLLVSQRRWRGALTAATATPRGLAVGFALGFGIGYFSKAEANPQARKTITLPALLSAVRALLYQ